jgi:imidazoleglycerol-phosphate dehydratase/histidinol-phosphatase
VCPHHKGDGCDCRKPKTKLVESYVREQNVDLAASAMIGDRDTDLEFATNLGVRGIRVRRHGAPEETWPAILRSLSERKARIQRKTKETDIEVRVNLDATGPVKIVTGIGFFDHMLEQIAKHGGFALELNCKGDLEIDEHHTVEDCALALGEALRAALGDKVGIARYGFLLPMDEAQVRVAIDLSGRAYGVFEGKFNREAVGGLPTELVPHFFKSLAESLKAAIHVTITGENTHHMIEACFKGTGRALRQAFRREGEELPSTKGVL